MSSDEDEFYYSDEDEYGEESDDEKAVKDGASAKASLKSGSRVSYESRSAVPLEEYQCLDLDDLMTAQQKVIEDVSTVLNLDNDKTNVLLLHFRWNKERLLDSYIADPEGTCLKAGALATEIDLKKKTKFVNCPIMLDEFPLDETYGMGCTCEEHPEEHRFSILAWQDYLRCKLEDGPDSVFSTCPMDSCLCVVSPQSWTTVLSMKTEADAKEQEDLQDSLKRYRKYLLNSFVDINKNMKWCPSAGCDTAISASGAVLEVTCKTCKYSFCFKCGRDSHAPISCRALDTWMEKCNNESETANWILANTKKCPKCSVRIEKNQGCNHVACRVCHYDFCWVCMGQWQDHSTSTGGYYNCNKFDPAEGADDEASKAKRELDRYLHYYKRYALHEQAGKFASKQRSATEEKMVKLQGTSGVGWIDVQFLDTAVKQLIVCRRVLKYTYAFAYYLPNGKEKNLFEHSQSDLEKYTERLSELTEQPVDKLNCADVMNMTRITSQFMKNLLNQVESEGMVELATEGALGLHKNAAAEVKSKDNGSKKKKSRH